MQKINFAGFIVDGAKPKKLEKIPVLICDKPGVNKKIYPSDVVKDAIERYKQKCQNDPTRRYIFAKHPKDEDEEWLGLIAGVVDDIWVDNGVVYANVTLLPTTWGYTIQWLLENGYTIGTSIRGAIKAEESYYKLENGKNIVVKVASYLDLDGFDFVVFPSYVVTQVRSEHVKEQRILPGEFSNEDEIDIICSLSGVCGCSSNIEQIEKVQEQASKVDNVISFDDIKKQLFNNNQEEKEFVKDNNTLIVDSQNLPTDNNTNETNDERRSVTMDKEKLQAEIERLKYEKARLELEYERTKEKVEKAQADLNLIQEELKKYTEKVKEQEQKIQAEEQVLGILASKKAELEKIEEQAQALQKQIEELESKKAELEKLISELEAKRTELEKTQEARQTNIQVKCCGKVFDENNPPKLRVVPVDELVSNKEWGSIDHDITRKLVWLTGDEEIARQVFGIVNMNQGWGGLKYPVYEHRKSSEDGYDVDLVLNLNGLRTALVFLMGRPGMALSRKEKKQLVEFLLKKYEELKKAGIVDNIPESLQNLAKSMKILEKVAIKVDDDVVGTLIETGIEKGLLDIELEETAEKVEVEVDPELLYKNYAIALASTLEGRELSLEPAIEQGGQGRGNAIQIQSYEDGIQRIWNLLMDTEIAGQLGLQSQDDFENYIAQIVQQLVNGEIVSALKAIAVLQDALRGTGAVHAVIPLVIFAVDKFGGNSPKGGNEEPQGNTQPEEGQGTENQPEEQTATEQTTTQSFDGKIINEIRNELMNRTTEQTKHEEVDVKPETFQAIKKLFEENFEGIQINSEDELIPVIEKLVNDYVDTYSTEEQLRLELAKKEALLKAVSEGVDLEVAKEKIESASTPEELETIIAQLKDELSTEKTQEKATGKGFSVNDVANEIKGSDEFDKLVDEI